MLFIVSKRAFQLTLLPHNLSAPWGQGVDNNMETYTGIVSNLKPIQEECNRMVSDMIKEMPYRKDFNKKYKECSFKFIPNFLKKLFRPMAYKCYKMGIEYQNNIL